MHEVVKFSLNTWHESVTFTSKLSWMLMLVPKSLLQCDGDKIFCGAVKEASEHITCKGLHSLPCPSQEIGTGWADSDRRHCFSLQAGFQ